MSAEIIYGVDFKARRRQGIEQMAIEIMNQCFPSWPGGIDDLIPEQAPYMAPDKDPA